MHNRQIHERDGPRTLCDRRTDKQRAQSNAAITNISRKTRVRLFVFFLGIIGSRLTKDIGPEQRPPEMVVYLRIGVAQHFTIRRTLTFSGYFPNAIETKASGPKQKTKFGITWRENADLTLKLD